MHINSICVLSNVSFMYSARFCQRLSAQAVVDSRSRGFFCSWGCQVIFWIGQPVQSFFYRSAMFVRQTDIFLIFRKFYDARYDNLTNNQGKVIYSLKYVLKICECLYSKFGNIVGYTCCQQRWCCRVQFHISKLL